MDLSDCLPVLCGLVYRCSTRIPIKASIVAHDGCLYDLSLKTPLKPGRVYEFHNFRVRPGSLEQTTKSKIIPTNYDEEFDQELSHAFLLADPDPAYKTVQVMVLHHFEHEVSLQISDSETIVLKELAFTLFTRFCRGRGPFTIQISESDLAKDTKTACTFSYTGAIWIVLDKAEEVTITTNRRVVSFTHPQSACGGLRKCSKCENVWGSSTESIASQDDDILID